MPFSMAVNHGMPPILTTTAISGSALQAARTEERSTKRAAAARQRGMEIFFMLCPVEILGGMGQGGRNFGGLAGRLPDKNRAPTVLQVSLSVFIFEVNTSLGNNFTAQFPAGIAIF